MNTDEHGWRRRQAAEQGGRGRRGGQAATRRRGLALRLLVIGVSVFSWAVPTFGQTLEGQWVRQSEQRIAQHRMAPIRIIVMDGDGNAAAGAKVQIQQLRHDFTLGFAVGQGGLDDIAWDQPVWRCFNAVSLDQLSEWPIVQPDDPRQWDMQTIEKAVAAATQRGLTLRWGGVISADAGRIPGWAAALDGGDLRHAAEAHLTRVLDAMGVRVGQFDIYTHSLDHDLFAQPMVRRLYEQAKAMAPRATMCIRFEDALTQARAGEMIARITDMRQAMIPFDAISLEQRVGGILLQAPLARTFDVIGRLGVDVTLASVEVGGASEAAAATNLETLLRTAFADPSVTGIYFAGVTDDTLVNPHAALISEFGFATEPGQRLDALFHGLWWTQGEFTADELGNVRTRVFAGSHRLTAQLAGGTALETTIYIPPPSPDRDARVILLEPLSSRR